MNLDGIKVDHSALDNAANDMLTTVNQIGDRMQQLEGDLKPLRQDWAGSAQQQYDVAKNKWDGAVEDMRSLLRDTHVQVQQSNADYKSADNRGHQAFEI